MKKLFAYLSVLILLSVRGFSQIEQVINVPFTSTSTPTYQALLNLPNDYATTTINYPLIVFLHGAGESVPPLSAIYNSTTAGGPAFFIEHGQWPTSFTNPADGQQYKFIVVTPQAANTHWSISAQMIPFIQAYLESHYRIDTNRVYYTGLSAGGEGFVEYASHLGVTPTRKFAAMVPMSEAGDNPDGQPWSAAIVADSVRTWGIGDSINDIHGFFTKALTIDINNVRSGFARFSQVSTGGHGPWNPQYNPTYRETFTWRGTTASMNIYEWMLINSRSSAVVTTPTANAGNNQTITQPTSTVTLSGSGTAGSGNTITAYTWVKLSGPSCVITTPGPSLTANSTTVTSMNSAGTYVFQLTVTNSASATAVSSVTITVLANSPVANAGPDQTITLPTNSATISASASTGGITSYLWSQVSGPNTGVIGSSTSVSTTISSLIAGVYKFKLSLNAGVSVDTVQVTVQAVQPCGPHTKYTLSENADSAICEGCSGGVFSFPYQPGDTIVIPSNPNAAGYYAFITFRGLNGNPTCPIIIQNDNIGQVWNKGQFQIDGCTYVKVSGTGAATQQYGFKMMYDPVIVPQVIGGMIIFDRSKNIEITNCLMTHVGTGLAILTDNNCDQSLDYPNWILDSMIIHDCKIQMTWNEGMYTGNTSPDNAFYDPRQDQCSVDQPSPTYSLPMKNGYTHIFNMVIDSTGRGGIQLGNVGGTNAISEINNNTVTHNGLNQDDAQGTAISFGLYSHVYCHDNFIRNTYTWGIASLGASGTNLPIRIENNRIDSCGYLKGFNRISTTPDEFYTPATETQTNDTLPWPYPVEFDVKPRVYTAAAGLPPSAPPGAAFGTAVKGTDSSEFQIKNNVFGLAKSTTRSPFSPGQRNPIQIFDYAPNPGLQKTGNVVCGNTFFNDAPALAWADSSSGNVIYATNCNTGTLPTLTACLNQTTGPCLGNITITLPLDTAFEVINAATTQVGATIASIVVTQISGPSVTIVNGSTTGSATTLALTTSFRNMDAAGTYVFSAKTTDSLGNIVTTTTTVIVNPAPVQTGNFIPVKKHSKKKIIQL